jgi:uncharacterized protein
VGALDEAALVWFEEGRAAFNGGEYFRAHELWEQAWQTLDGAERILMQGLIQIAAGLHHLKQRRLGPAAGLLRKGLNKVARGTFAQPAGLRIDALTVEVERLLAEMEQSGTGLPPSPIPLKL